MPGKLNPEKFLQVNRPWAQAHANASRESTDLHRDPTGKARLLLHQWPSPKSWHLVATATPAPSQRSRPATPEEFKTSSQRMFIKHASTLEKLA